MALITIVFILAFFGCLLLALILDGVWAFYIYQLVYFLNPDNRWWGSTLPSLKYSFITVAFMFVGLLIHGKKAPNISRYSDMPLSKWILGILFMYVFMYFFALSPEHHMTALIEFTKLIIIVAIAYKLINTPKKLDYVIWAYILGASYIGYVATGMGRNRGDRLEGIGTIDSPDSNGTAAIMGPALIYLLFYVWRSKNIYVKALAVVCGAFIANGIVLINSRGTFLAVVIAATVYVGYMIFSKYQRGGQRATAIFLIIAGISGALVVTDDLFWERMATLQEVDDEEGDRGGAHRIDFWFASFDIMRDYPLGVGVRGYNMVSSRYIDPSLTKGGTANKSVHSSWFQGLTEIGWPGPILFFGMLYSAYRLSKKTKQYLVDTDQIDEYYKMLAIECALLCFLVAISFINKFRGELLYWLILFLACAINLYYLQKNVSESKKTISHPTASRK